MLRDTTAIALQAAIWNHGPISRTQLAGVTGLAPSTITRLTRSLRNLGLIRELSKGRSSGGRQPVMLSIDAAAGLVVVVDLSGFVLRAAVLDATGHPVAMRTWAFNRVGSKAVGEQVKHIIADLLADPILGGRTIRGIGVSVPGRVDVRTGTIEDATTLDSRDFRLGEMLREHFGLPVFGEHDTIAAALAIKYYGAGQGFSNLIDVAVSSGIGAGIIVNNEPYRGEHRLAGKSGHITVERHGQVCWCGKRGCLETVASGAAMVAAAGRVLGRTDNDIDAFGIPLTVEAVTRAANGGHQLAQAILSSAANYLAMAIATLSCILDIRLVIIGGEVAEAGDVFFTPLAHALENYQLNCNMPEIVPAQLRHDAALAGVGMVALQRVLGLSRRND